MATACTLGSLAVLVAGFLCMQGVSALADGDSISGLGVAFMAAVGVVFIHLQTLAVTLALTLAFDPETRPHCGSSDVHKAEGRQGENS